MYFYSNLVQAIGSVLKYPFLIFCLHVEKYHHCNPYPNLMQISYITSNPSSCFPYNPITVQERVDGLTRDEDPVRFAGSGT